MKLLEAITALVNVEGTRALGEALRGELGEHANIDAKDLVKRLTTSETQVAELTTQVKTLDEKAKGADALKATVDKYESEKSETLLSTSFAAAAKTHGIRADAIATARKLIDAGAIKVDLAKGKVEGLTKELFDGLRTAHVVLFETATPEKKDAPAPINPPAPAAPHVTTQATPDLPGAMGYFVQASKL